MNRNIFTQMRATRWLTLLLTLAVMAGPGSLASLAQQVPAPATIRLSPEDLERGQHGSQSNFFFLPPGKTGEDYQSAGFFGQKLRPYLGNNTQSLSELDNYRRQKTLFLIDKALLVGSVGLYASQVFSHGDATYTNSTQIAAGGVAVVSLLATIFINQHTNEYLKQAVDNYNTDLPASRHGLLWPRLRPAGMGLAATAQGQPLLALHWQL